LKLLILALFAAMCVSLGSGLVFLMGSKPSSAKLGAALTLRVALAVLLFLALMGAWRAGLIKPHGIAR
jgi:Protein of unknown function (DUF2909)